MRGFRLRQKEGATMGSNEKISGPAPAPIDYFALIRAYKVIRAFRQLAPKPVDEALQRRFDAWRNDPANQTEKEIAESVVVQERMYSFFLGEEINEAVGFTLIPDEEHL